LIRHLRPTYETLLDWSYRGKGIPWSINEVPCRIDPHYRQQLGRHYDAPVAAFLRRQVRPGSVCLNVGANVGAYVLQLAHWSGPDGRVVAFEPNPAASAVLQKHIELNRLAERVTVVDAAVGASAGQAVLYAAGTDPMSRIGLPNPAIGQTTTELSVPVVTLDQYCHDQGLSPDWLVMDIEGFELAALAGARWLLKTQRQQVGLVVEMHPNAWPDTAIGLGRAEDFLGELGLTPVPLTGQAHPLKDHGIVYLAYL
jgi:FkbM family methyltransferase